MNQLGDLSEAKGLLQGFGQQILRKEALGMRDDARKSRIIANIRTGGRSLWA
jgi:hypothetical protein